MTITVVRAVKAEANFAVGKHAYAKDYSLSHNQTTDFLLFKWYHGCYARSELGAFLLGIAESKGIHDITQLIQRNKKQVKQLRCRCCIQEQD